MVEIRQIGLDGRTYDTDDYPFISIRNPHLDDGYVTGRFSTEEKAHAGRLMEQLNNPDDITMIFNEKEKKFIDWRPKERRLFEKYKSNPSDYFDQVEKCSGKKDEDKCIQNIK